MNCFIICFVLCLLIFVLTLIFAKRINEKINNLKARIKSVIYTTWGTTKNYFKANKIIYIIILVLTICTAMLISYCIKR